jgi:hypothetical protein
MLRARPIRTHLPGAPSSFAPDDDELEADGFTCGEAIRLYGGRSAPWSSLLPKELVQELLKQQMAVAYRPPGERARVLTQSRVWEHLQHNADAQQLLQHIIALDLHELQSMWTGLAS